MEMVLVFGTASDQQSWQLLQVLMRKGAPKEVATDGTYAKVYWAGQHVCTPEHYVRDGGSWVQVLSGLPCLDG